MWWLAICCAASLGGLVAGWAVRQRMERLLAVETDRRARDAHGHHAEVIQLRRGRLAEALVVQSAVAVVDDALRVMEQEGGR
ncbi:hypothetical protein ACFVY4_26835 [Streptomyces sp. NPDC058299]|uniref:hypothetical protein n=1 Tax=Streptomyces sp. NPDC058299 TaxID=3346435 RepID=UPI0036E81459